MGDNYVSQLVLFKFYSKSRKGTLRPLKSLRERWTPRASPEAGLARFPRKKASCLLSRD